MRGSLLPSPPPALNKTCADGTVVGGNADCPSPPTLHFGTLVGMGAAFGCGSFAGKADKFCSGVGLIVTRKIQGECDVYVPAPPKN
jgi:hypothetical protein